MTQVEHKKNETGVTQKQNRRIFSYKEKIQTFS